MSSTSSPQSQALTSPTAIAVLPSPTTASTSRPNTVDVPEFPQELLASARSLRNQSMANRSGTDLLNQSQNSSRRRKKKKPPAPPQAHPEPKGADEAEVRMMWNRVAPPLLNGNKMTTPNEPPTLYSHTTTNAIAGGLRDQPSVAALTQPLIEAPRNLLSHIRGPLEVFVANGSHPKIGWMVPDNCQLAVKPQSFGGEIQIIGGTGFNLSNYNSNNNNNTTSSTTGGLQRPRTSDSYGTNDDGESSSIGRAMSTSSGGNNQGSTAVAAAVTVVGAEPLTLQPFEPPPHMHALQQQYQQGERASMMLSMQHQRKASPIDRENNNNASGGAKDGGDNRDSRQSTSRRRSRSASGKKDDGTNNKDISSMKKPTSPISSSEIEQQQQMASFLSSAVLLQQPELKDLIQQVHAKPPEASTAMFINHMRYASSTTHDNNNHKGFSNTSPEDLKQQFQDRIALLANLREDSETLMTERHLEECTQWMLDLSTAVQNERHLFTQWKHDLSDDIRKLQLDRARAQADHEEEQQLVQSQQRAALYLRENDLERLKERREKVVDSLTEKKRILRSLRETSIQVEEAERASTLKLLDVEDDLRRQRGRLEDVLRAKLQNAVEQMSQLSDAQRKARESSTVEDFNRLVKELTEQEQKMRELNSSSGKLQHRIATLKREISLESQRGQMLQEKQESYHASISTLVHRLEDIERKYSAQSQRELTGFTAGGKNTTTTRKNNNSPSPGAVENDGGNNNNHNSDEIEQDKNFDSNNNNNNNNNSNVTIDLKNANRSKNGKFLLEQQQAFLMNSQLKELPNIIDQQYAVILQLRADLVRVRQEVLQATENLKQERIAIVAPANPSNQPILSRVAKKEQTREFMIEQNHNHSQQQQLVIANNNNNNSNSSHHTSHTNTPATGFIKPRPPSTSSNSGGGGNVGSRPQTNNSNSSNSIPNHHNSHQHQQQQLRTLTAGQLSVVDTMRTTEMNFVKNIVFEALTDADQNLLSVVTVTSASNNTRHFNNYDNNNGHQTTINNNSTNQLLPPMYPVLELLDPVQRRDVFDFVVRRINTKMLNPMKDSSEQHMSENGSMFRAM